MSRLSGRHVATSTAAAQPINGVPVCLSSLSDSYDTLSVLNECRGITKQERPHRHDWQPVKLHGWR